MQNNNPPTVTAIPSVVGINEEIQFSSMFTVSDPDINSEVQLYRFRDNGIAGGEFRINGISQSPNEWIEITSAQLASVTYFGDFEESQETFSVQVFDGLFWSNVALGTITSGNSSPEVSVSNGRVSPFEYRRIDRQFSVSDADGDPIVRYLFIDRNADQDGGHFTLRRQRLPSATYFFLEAGDLPDLEYRGGTFGPQVEVISVQAYDGFSWSEEVSFGMLTSSKSLITAPDATVLTDQRVLATSLFTVFDPDGDSVFAYNFIDRRINADGGYFEFQGNRLQSGQWFTVLATDIDELFYVGGSTAPQFETVSMQVYDGFEFSDITSFDVKTTERPMVEGRDADVQANQFINFATGSTANVPGVIGPATDPILTFSDDIERFQFIDRRINSNGGYFLFKGARVPSATWFVVEADELDQLEYAGGIFGPQDETISAMAFSNGVWSPQDDFVLSTLKNTFRPELTLFNVKARLDTVLELETMFTWSDADNDLLRTFGVYDTNADADSGYFTVNDVVQPGRTWIILPIDQVQNVKYHMPSTAGSENIRMFVNDGNLSSVQQIANMEAVPTPVIETLDTDISVDTLESVAASTLFAQIDGGPALTQWQVYDENFDMFPDTPPDDRSGRLFLRQGGSGNNGEELEGGVVHTLTAEQFARLDFQGAEVDFGRQLDPILVRATNGVTGWSEWHRVNMNTDPVGGDSLISGTFHNAVVEDGKTVITYSFIDGGNQAGGTRNAPNYPPLPIYYPPGAAADEVGREALGTRALDQAMRETHREAFAFMERFMNVDFVEVPFTLDAAEASIVIGAWGPFDGALASASAYAYLPADGDGRGNVFADIWYDVADFPINGTETGLGSFYRSTVYHEIGHAVGLKHPFQGDPALSIFNNFDYNTIMAYEHDNANNPFDPYPEQGSSMMLYDFVELQRLYGANMTYNTNNNHYGNLFSGSSPHFIDNSEQHQTTLWDAGGIDTLNYTNHTGTPVIAGRADLDFDGVIGAGDTGTISARLNFDVFQSDISIIAGGFDTNGDGAIDATDVGFVNNITVIAGELDINGDGQITAADAGGVGDVGERIDLREGTWSSINGVDQSLRIGYDVVIENARGGSGDDVIVGNEIDNLLFGNDGYDILRGGGGNDVYRGGRGNDAYVWSLGDGRDLVREEGSGGTDVAQFFDPSGSITMLEDDFTFRRFGNDLRIDLTLNQGPGQGTMLIMDYANVESRVEVLQIHGLGGNQIGGNIDLTSIFATADATPRQYRVTETMGTYGFLAEPVA